jgi:hypothetical protein
MFGRVGHADQVNIRESVRRSCGMTAGLEESKAPRVLFQSAGDSAECLRIFHEHMVDIDRQTFNHWAIMETLMRHADADARRWRGVPPAPWFS